MRRGLAVLAVAAMLIAAGVHEGNRAFREGRFADAEAAYRAAIERGDDGALVRYNLGTALLRQGRYEEAREHFEIAAMTDGPEAVRQAARYNSGNTGLEPAFVLPLSAARVEMLRHAVVEYRAALLLDPSDEDAKWNLELAQRLLEAAGGGGGGGGGGGADGDEGRADATPDAAPEPGGDGGEAGMSETPAERVLRQAAARDRELQQERLRRTTAPPPGVRDW
jgi:tetratricopeptide (TPR) repeat protein